MRIFGPHAPLTVFFFRLQFMKIIADENIPLLAHFFGDLGEVVEIAGSDIHPHTLAGADVLIVRSVTRVDRSLLAGSSVRFVGTATAGTDHVDEDYLAAANIKFAYAPGSNADSVVDYVIAALYALAADCDCELTGKHLGVVGVGAVGSRLVRRARGLGMEILCSDPPREQAGLTESDSTTRSDFVDLSTLLEASDVVSLHLPMTTAGAHMTYRLIGDDELARLAPAAWFVNTSRGAVVDERALRAALVHQPDLHCVLDVWDGEPTPDTDLMRRVRLGTPHIAGYSFDAKVAGAYSIARALCAHVGAETPEIADALPRERLIYLGSTDVPGRIEMKSVVDSMYDFAADVEAFAAVREARDQERAKAFRSLRRLYPKRRDFSAWDVVIPRTYSDNFRNALERGLGVRVLADQGS